MKRSEPEFPDELRDVAARLRAERPTLSALELDDVQRRARVRLEQRSRTSTRRYSIMRSRLTITAVLVLGLLFSTGGATLALSGTSESGNAASGVYPTTPTSPTMPHVVATILTTTPSKNRHASGPPVSVQPTVQSAQPARQQVAATSSSSLPFTGFAAIPILIGGLALLALGVALRRGARSNP